MLDSHNQELIMDDLLEMHEQGRSYRRINDTRPQHTGLLSMVNTGFTNPGNPSEPSLFSALFLAIPISLFFFSTSGAHFRVSTGGHVPEVPE
ncbi:hypothetical protein TNCV_686981 [Trichonephila clavipes]|nr:hypothetical protein TNCV_686981 [Trichonephila clavipes]